MCNLTWPLGNECSPLEEYQLSVEYHLCGSYGVRPQSNCFTFVWATKMLSTTWDVLVEQGLRGSNPWGMFSCIIWAWFASYLRSYWYELCHKACCTSGAASVSYNWPGAVVGNLLILKCQIIFLKYWTPSTCHWNSSINNYIKKRLYRTGWRLLLWYEVFFNTVNAA